MEQASNREAVISSSVLVRMDFSYCNSILHKIELISYAEGSVSIQIRIGALEDLKNRYLLSCAGGRRRKNSDRLSEILFRCVPECLRIPFGTVSSDAEIPLFY